MTLPHCHASLQRFALDLAWMQLNPDPQNLTLPYQNKLLYSHWSCWVFPDFLTPRCAADKCSRLMMLQSGRPLTTNVCRPRRQLAPVRVCVWSARGVWGHFKKKKKKAWQKACREVESVCACVYCVCVCGWDCQSTHSHPHWAPQRLKVFDVCWPQFVVFQLWVCKTHQDDSTHRDQVRQVSDHTDGGRTERREQIKRPFFRVYAFC